MMNIMISINGEPDQTSFLPEIAALGAGIELGSYGVFGVRSERDWADRFAMHKAIRAQFHGRLALHGPFIGMEYAHVDHLIRGVVNRRLDMIYEVAVNLKAGRVVLHSGLKPEIVLFKQEDDWLARNIPFWQEEIRRWANAGIEIVLENDTQRQPDPLIRLVNAVDQPALGLCLDTGHQNLFASQSAPEWVRAMGARLYHIHLHDNDGVIDRHWSPGRGMIDFEPFFAALEQHAPGATISLEVEGPLDVVLGDLRRLAARFA